MRDGEIGRGIRIAHDMADPNSLYNRPAKVVVLDVTGAPGDRSAIVTGEDTCGLERRHLRAVEAEDLAEQLGVVLTQQIGRAHV